MSLLKIEDNVVAERILHFRLRWVVYNKKTNYKPHVNT